VKFLAGMSDNDRDMTVVTTIPDVVYKQERNTDSCDSTYVTAGAFLMQSLYATQRFTSQLLLGMDINKYRINIFYPIRLVKKLVWSKWNFINSQLKSISLLRGTFVAVTNGAK